MAPLFLHSPGPPRAEAEHRPRGRAQAGPQRGLNLLPPARARGGRQPPSPRADVSGSGPGFRGAGCGRAGPRCFPRAPQSSPGREGSAAWEQPGGAEGGKMAGAGAGRQAAAGRC